jgi:hypothetical protein
MVRTWLDGVGAMNPHTGPALEAPDAVRLEAVKRRIGKQYNGLSGAKGKAAVVQLLRMFTPPSRPPRPQTPGRAKGSVQHPVRSVHGHPVGIPTAKTGLLDISGR